MKVEHLAEMANHIGEFFAAEPLLADGVEGVRNHISKFWEPRMRKQLIAYYYHGGEELAPIVKNAVKLLAEAGPKPQPVTDGGDAG